MKKLHKNSLNKEIIRQKFFLPVFLKLNQTFRLINKGTSCLLYKSNWKFWNFSEVATKNICKLLKLAN